MTHPGGPLKEKLSRGESCICMFNWINSTSFVEIIARSGIDCVVIDREHGTFSWESVVDLVTAAQVAGVPSLVRVEQASRVAILKALDAGAAGIMVPRVNTAEEARQIVQWSLFPPQGDRGFASIVKGASYGFKPAAKHIAESNTNTLTVVQIETVEAIENLSEIIQVEGIDIFFIGPADLSVSMGHSGNYAHPEVTALIAKAVDTIRVAGKRPGILAADGQNAAEWIKAGCQMILGSPNRMLMQGLSQYLAAAR